MMRAALEEAPVRIRNPNSIRPWQHVLSPLSGYLVLAQALWSDAEHARGWNFGPADEDARPVGWIVERLREQVRRTRESQATLESASNFAEAEGASNLAEPEPASELAEPEAASEFAAPESAGACELPPE